MKERIFLVVDDDSDDRELFIEAVQEIFPSAQCFSAYNGDDALSQIRQKKITLPDYIFLDLNMSGMDGIECLTELKRDKALRDIPVVIYSTSSNPKDKEKTKELGAIYFLTKPVSFRKLSEEVQHVIEQAESGGL